ncbi:eukaryotic translation initiation factor-relatedfamily protein [Striga asiatica]|uniref:Eukaryotic translation initiation factor-relatedfamily protein n=1 Tax=Striga asiatica TaxID=4170 RepID=A0A5A7R6T1_STRAF|nr:eukaryotic translation initiation factor-relatedfamily protein [Striga asiatica]
MSKKKATMTLKDFHGGSIPSDLRLPSAPGVSMRPVDRSGFDRQMSWGSSAGRPEHRARPASAGSIRNLDEKAPFMSYGPHIGRNFDEDERKPLEGPSGQRRPILDENVHPQLSHPVETKVGSQAASTPATSYAGRVSEVPKMRSNSQTSSGNSSYGSNDPVIGSNSGQAAAGSYPNAWGIRKEAAGIKEHVPSAWSAPDAETKLAHASALEKISSGRWNSKQHVHFPKDTEVSVHEEKAYSVKTQDRPEVLGSPGYGKEVPSHDRVRSTSRMDSFERNMSVAVNGPPSVVPSESSERPKLKLLPRSKPIENVELPTDYYKQTSNPSPVEDSYAVHEPKISLHSGAAGPVVDDRAPERAKLNLKPRSQTTEQPEGNNESKSCHGMTLSLESFCFGFSLNKFLYGACSWHHRKTGKGIAVTYFEIGCKCNLMLHSGPFYKWPNVLSMVLKERGIEDNVSSYESQSPLRAKATTPKADMPTHLPPSRHNEKPETNSSYQKIANKYPNPEKFDPHRRNRPNEIHKNNRPEVDKNRNQQQKQDRAPSPETWRKPVGPEGLGQGPSVRYGKAASAVELAQAFSKSVSDPAASRGVSGRGQVPFSRLTGPTSRPQINGY